MSEPKTIVPQLWERQPWDTDASFHAFHSYYLPQEPPRSLPEAYRQYRREKGAKEASKIKRAPGNWERWAYGKNSKGIYVPGAYAWVERAAAYDSYLAAQDRDVWEERRRELRQLDWEFGQKLRELAERILEASPNFLQAKRRLIPGRDGQPDQEIINVAIKAELLPKLVEVASKLQRLAAEMETERKTHEHTGKDGGPIEVRRVEELTDDELAAIIYEEYGEQIDVWRRNARNN